MLPAVESVNPETVVRQSRRADRWAARGVVRALLSGDRLSSHEKRARECGRAVRDAAGVSVKVTTAGDGSRSAGFAGLSSCGSVWACPVCSSTIANVRQGEIAAAVGEWTRRGGRVVMLTMTMRHHQGQALSMLWDALSDAKHSALSGGSWQAEQRVWGSPFARTIVRGKRAGEVVCEIRVPTISLVEVTNGAAGWHVHLHALLFVSAAVGEDDVPTLAGSIFGRWRASLDGLGLSPDLWCTRWKCEDGPDQHSHGMEAHLVSGREAAEKLGAYFAKGVYVPVGADDVRAASMEVARGDMKNARYGNRTPFGLLAGLVAVTTSGDLGGVAGDSAAAVAETARLAAAVARDEALWHEWEAGSAGRRQIAWSAGLRAYLARALPAELTDSEIVDADLGGEEVAAVPALTWAAILRARAGCAVLCAFEVSTVAGAELLARYAGEGFAWAARRGRGG